MTGRAGRFVRSPQLFEVGPLRKQVPHGPPTVNNLDRTSAGQVLNAGRYSAFQQIPERAGDSRHAFIVLGIADREDAAGCDSQG